MQGHVRLGPHVGVEHRTEIGATEHVAVEDHHVVGAQPRQHVADTAAGTERLGLGDVLDLETEVGTVGEVLLEDLGLERGAEDDVFDACLTDPCEQMGEERHPRGGQHRLGCRQRQRA